MTENVTYTAFFCPRYAEGQCGEAAYYHLDRSTKKLVIYGEGDMYDSQGYLYDDENNKYVEFYSIWGDELSSVEIQEGITSIGDYAFYDPKTHGANDRNSLIYGEVSIPASVKRIGKYAFGNNSSSSFSVSIANGSQLEEIDKYAFYYCGIDSFIIPDTVKTIGVAAFIQCNRLSEIFIPSSVSSIGVGAFYCIGLGSVTFGENSHLTSIPRDAFAQNTITSISIPEGVSSIEEQAFNSCYFLRSVVLPSTVTNIERTAFYWQKMLTIYIYIQIPMD